MKEADKILRCPRCGGRDVRRSRHRRAWDSLMLALRRVPQRCRSCQNRFYTYLARAADEHQEVAGHQKAADQQTAPANQSETR